MLAALAAGDEVSPPHVREGGLDQTFFLKTTYESLKNEREKWTNEGSEANWTQCMAF